jgi:hypothetical protein
LLALYENNPVKTVIVQQRKRKKSECA